MNSYFFNITNEDREDIRAKHKTLYDGYVTLNKTSNTQPLTVEDLAGDKNGITINNKGEISTYKNYKINESEVVCPSCGLSEDTCKCEKDEQQVIGDMHEQNDDETVEGDCEVDEELSDGPLDESVKEQRNLILDMFNRFKHYN